MKHKIQSLIMITLSTFIMAVGVYFFKFPDNFCFGGITGFATVVAKVTPHQRIQFYLYRQYHPVSHRLYLFGKILCPKDDLFQYALIRLIGIF